MDRKQLMTIEEAAAIARISPGLICRWLKQGRFTALVDFRDVMPPYTPRRRGSKRG